MTAPVDRSTWLPILEAYRPQLRLSLLRMIDKCVGAESECDGDFNDAAVTADSFWRWYLQDAELPPPEFPELPYSHPDPTYYVKAMVYELAAEFVQASLKWQKGEPPCWRIWGKNGRSQEQDLQGRA